MTIRSASNDLRPVMDFLNECDGSDPFIDVTFEYHTEEKDWLPWPPIFEYHLRSSNEAVQYRERPQAYQPPYGSNFDGSIQFHVKPTSTVDGVHANSR